MKKIIASLLVIALLSGCTGSTSFGECRGLAEEKEAHLVYNPSWWNVFLALIFAPGGAIVPIVTVGWYLECPVGKVPEAK